MALYKFRIIIIIIIIIIGTRKSCADVSIYLPPRILFHWMPSLML